MIKSFINDIKQKNNSKKLTNFNHKKEIKIKNKERNINIFGYIVLSITVISLVILAICSAIFGYREAIDMGVAGVPLSVQYALALFIATLISILIILIIVKKFFWKPLNNHLESRKENIASNINEASLKNEESKLNYEKSLKEKEKSKKNAKEIIEASKKEAILKKREILDDAKKQSEKILEQSRNQIEKEKIQMMQEIKNEIIETSLMVAEKIIEKEIDNKTNEKMIEELLLSLK